jgi:flagella basal body P-ring formation protein FlgA
MTVIGMLSISSFGVAWTLGYFKDEPKQAAASIDRTGKLAFPATIRPIRAYEQVTRDDFIDPRTNQPNVIWLSEAMAEVALRDFSEIVGRVASRDIQARMVLREDDFLEEGTRPGMVAGIPAGKFAMSIPVSGIPGLEQLRGGDRFDLLVSLPKSGDGDLLSNSEPAALFGGIKPASLRVGQLSRQHGVKHLVTNGTLINLYSGSQRTTQGPVGLTVKPGGGQSRSTTSSTVFAELAVDPEEIGPLTEAISLGTKMTCVLRSGKPDAGVDDEMSTEGMVPVITTATSVNAFSALTDENLMDESTGRLHFYYFPPDKISEEWITEPAKLYGRVVARPLRRGSLITENDLLPPGTRPGISAGLQSGMAGMSLSKSNVQGFENLSVGDRFSILTKVPGEVTASSPNTTWATLLGGQPDSDDARIAEMVRTGIREVVRDAVYLAETEGDSVIIGVPEMEVAKLAQLIRDEAEVFAVARSSQDGHKKDEVRSLKLERQGSHFTLHASNFQSSSQPAPLPEAGRGETELRLVNQNQSNNPFENAPRQDDKIAVPILVQEVPAYEELTIDDFVDPTTGRVQTLYFDRANIDKDWELDIRKLIDRVALRPLRAGRPVRAIDLAPLGSPAGPAIGLEPGMRAVTVNAAQLVGLETLKVGTIFDLVAARGVEVNALADTVRQSIASSDAVKEATKLPAGRVASSRTVATAVKLLSNTGVTQIMIPKSTGPTETQTQTRLTADGSTVTETVKSDPITFEERTVPQYVLAIQSEFVGSVLGLLDDQNPLYVSVRPLSNDVESERFGNHNREIDRPVRAVIQEHVRGQDITSEVFLTDRPEPLAMTASDDHDNASDLEGR